MRYWLVVPSWKTGQALRAGCHYSPGHRLWYVEEPFRKPFTLADFAAWKPVEHNELAMRQKQYVEAARAKRLRKKKRKQQRKARAGVRSAVTRNPGEGVHRQAASQPRQTGQSQRR